MRGTRLVTVLASVFAGTMMLQGQPIVAHDDEEGPDRLNKPGLTATLSCENLAPFVFMPMLFHFEVEKSTPYVPHPIQGFDMPIWEFVNGGPRTLSLDFELRTATDIGTTVSKLSAAAFVHPDFHRPPVCVLAMGPFTFKGLATEVKYSYSEIDADGTRHRVRISMKFLNRLDQSEQLRVPAE